MVCSGEPVTAPDSNPGPTGTNAKPLTVRPAIPDDAEGIAAVLRDAFSRARAPEPDAAKAMEPGGAALLMQTGSALLVCADGDRVVGVVRHHDDEGVAWFDLLASTLPGAGSRLVKAVGTLAQDGGLRLVRARIPDEWPYPEYFGRLGYSPVSRETGPAGAPLLVIERRLPLLTVREQRRSDAQDIAALTGRDPWPFEQNLLPGWFVLADGDRVAGVVAAQDQGAGVALVLTPSLSDEYRNRGLELWMVERAAYWAETNGFHTLELEPGEAIERLQRDFEDRRWFREGPVLRKRLVHQPSRWEEFPEPEE